MRDLSKLRSSCSWRPPPWRVLHSLPCGCANGLFQPSRRPPTAPSSPGACSAALRMCPKPLVHSPAPCSSWASLSQTCLHGTVSMPTLVLKVRARMQLTLFSVKSCSEKERGIPSSPVCLCRRLQAVHVQRLNISHRLQCVQVCPSYGSACGMLKTTCLFVPLSLCFVLAQCSAFLQADKADPYRPESQGLPKASPGRYARHNR